MTDAPFHATRMGRRFYEHSVPELIRALQRLNDTLERLVELREAELRRDPQGAQAPRGGGNDR